MLCYRDTCIVLFTYWNNVSRFIAANVAISMITANFPAARKKRIKEKKQKMKAKRLVPLINIFFLAFQFTHQMLYDGRNWDRDTTQTQKQEHGTMLRANPFPLAHETVSCKVLSYSSQSNKNPTQKNLIFKWSLLIDAQ